MLSSEFCFSFGSGASFRAGRKSATRRRRILLPQATNHFVVITSYPCQNSELETKGSIMSDLFQHSIDVILKNQAPSGAYIASPNFPTYAYSWLRDGSFIAHAMDRVGQHDSSARFHRWVGGVVRRYHAKLDDLLARQAGRHADRPGRADAHPLHARRPGGQRRVDQLSARRLWHLAVGAGRSCAAHRGPGALRRAAPAGRPGGALPGRVLAEPLLRLLGGVRRQGAYLHAGGDLRRAERAGRLRPDGCVGRDGDWRSRSLCWSMACATAT